jgi:molybdenum cofactor synthesis domain-containing protein
VTGRAPGVNPAPRAQLFSVGSELLRGEVVDTNAAELAAEMARLGLELQGTRHLPDDRAVIAGAFAAVRAEVELVVATGGLGPTHDDVTREGLADALGEMLAPDPALVERLHQRFGGAERMPESNLRQALRIPSAESLENPIGSAPGWWTDRDGRVAVLMPGVPSEMRRMWAEQVVPRLERRFALRPLHVRSVKLFGIGESAVAERVGSLLEAPGDGVVAGIYAKDDGVHLRFTTREDAALLDGPVAQALSALADHAWGTDDDALPGLALVALGRAGVRTLATTESGTDGALLSLLAAREPGVGEARFVGGTLVAADADDPPEAPGPAADAVMRVALHPADRLGRSRVSVALATSPGARALAVRIALVETPVRIHGSGPQRQRRAAYAALDAVRRGLG